MQFEIVIGFVLCECGNKSLTEAELFGLKQEPEFQGIAANALF